MGKDISSLSFVLPKDSLYQMDLPDTTFLPVEPNQWVIYDNRVNIGLTGLKKTDRDIFMTCAYKLKDKKTTVIELGYTELMKLARFKHMTLDEFNQYLKTGESVSDVKLTYEDSSGNILKAPLFSLFLADRKRKTLKLKVNEEFVNIFSALTKNFTELDLVIYTSLKSKYSKILYENLCQWRNRKTLSGFWDIPLEDGVRENQPVGFFTLFDVPKNYIKNKKRILDDIIKPAVEELGPYMWIEVTPKTERKRGNPLIGYRFDFEEKREKMMLIPDSKEIEEIDADYISRTYGISRKSADTVLREAEKHSVSSGKVVDILDRIRKTSNVRDPGAYAVYLIQNELEDHLPKKAKNSFADFPQRKYDMKKLEKMILTGVYDESIRECGVE